MRCLYGSLFGRLFGRLYGRLYGRLTLTMSVARILCLARAKIALLYEKAFSQPRHTGPKGLQSRLHGNWPCQNSIQHTHPRRFYIDAYSA